MTDAELCAKLKIRHGIELSCRSVAQYRQDLSLRKNAARRKIPKSIDGTRIVAIWDDLMLAFSWEKYPQHNSKAAF